MPLMRTFRLTDPQIFPDDVRQLTHSGTGKMGESECVAFSYPRRPGRNRKSVRVEPEAGFVVRRYKSVSDKQVVFQATVDYKADEKYSWL